MTGKFKNNVLLNSSVISKKTEPLTELRTPKEFLSLIFTCKFRTIEPQQNFTYSHMHKKVSKRALLVVSDTMKT